MFHIITQAEGFLMNTVFISHSHVDNEFCNRIALEFEIRGFNVYLDDWDLNAGDQLEANIMNMLEQTKWFIIVLTPESSKSQWVHILQEQSNEIH